MHENYMETFEFNSKTFYKMSFFPVSETGNP